MLKRSANPCTPVRFRARPPRQPTENQDENREHFAARHAHEANKERSACGTKAGTAAGVTGRAVSSAIQAAFRKALTRNDAGEAALTEAGFGTKAEAHAGLIQSIANCCPI